MTNTATLSAKMVFLRKSIAALALAVAAVFWVVFNILDGLLFISPVLTFYYPLPEDSLPGFILSNITAGLVGIVIGMNVYIFKYQKVKIGTSFFSGSTLGTVSSMCVSCSSIGFFLATTFGGAGVAASSFMSNYQIPLRLVAIGLLLWAYYSAHRKITMSCRVNS